MSSPTDVQRLRRRSTDVAMLAHELELAYRDSNRAETDANEDNAERVQNEHEANRSFEFNVEIGKPKCNSWGSVALNHKLVAAVSKGDKNLVASLIDSKADVNARNVGSQTVLHVAVVSPKSEDVLPILIANKADPTQQDMWGNVGNSAILQ